MKNKTSIYLLGLLASVGFLQSAHAANRDVRDVFGLTYFTFLNGPGLMSETSDYCPNHLGLASNDGINAQNHVSVKWKFSERWALDFQARFFVIFNNYIENKNFSPLRWESPRIGISGNLLKGSDWSLKGAINTEFPYFLPSPLSGYQVQQRMAIFNPGMFASFNWEPKNSRWSIFSVVNPRVYFYADRNVAEIQLSKAGSSPRNKPDLMLSFMPTVNYLIAPKWKASLGITIDYRKQVTSEWNPFNASLITNGDGPAWRLKEMPVAIGVTHEITDGLTIFPFITAYPIAAQRFNANTGTQATFWESASIGMWLNGTVF